MDTFFGFSSAAWTAMFTLGLLVVAVAAAWYAHRQWKIGRDQVANAHRAEAERIRPYVIVTVEPSQATRKLFDLVIRNVGLRPAVDVEVALDPKPLRAHEGDGYKLADAKMLCEPIALIAPGQELRIFYDSHIDRNGRDDLPTAHTANLRYRDTSGHQFHETSILDLEATRGAAHVDVYTVHDVAKTLHEIERRLTAASVLERSGSLDIDAACERREEKYERLQRGHDEAIRAAHDLARRVLPDQTKTDGDDGSSTTN